MAYDDDVSSRDLSALQEGVGRAPFRPLDATEELIEEGYKDVNPGAEELGLFTAERFWADFATFLASRGGGGGGDGAAAAGASAGSSTSFLSGRFADCGSGGVRNEVLACLAVLGLPFDADADGPAARAVRPASRVAVRQRRVRSAPRRRSPA